MAAGNVVNRQLALLFGECPVLAMPTDFNAVPAQNGTLLGGEKLLVLLHAFQANHRRMGKQLRPIPFFASRLPLR
jgi:hypothetical protein